MRIGFRLNHPVREKSLRNSIFRVVGFLLLASRPMAAKRHCDDTTPRPISGGDALAERFDESKR